MESVAALIVKYDTIINSVFWFLILLFIFSYINLRAGSGYSIANRLWQFFLGTQSFTDRKLNTFWIEINDIEHFNMLFNVQAKSKIEIKKFINWIKINKIDVAKISRAKGWFNISTLEVLVPRKKTTFFIFICLVSCIFLFFVTLTIATKPAALVKINDNEPWIWVGKNYNTTNYIPNINLKRFKWENWSFTLEDCGNKEFNRDNFSIRSKLTIETINMLCKSYLDVDDQKSISKIIKKQNAFFFISLIPFVYSFYFFIIFIRRIFAFELSFEINRKNIKHQSQKK
ncbi:MAG TPA: DUF6216 family protein [Buttiauxella sp.]|jgi:hypothetical protein